MRLAESEHVARELDNRDLHTETNSEVGDFVCAGIIDGRNLALDAAAAESARHQYRIELFECVDAVGLDRIGIDLDDVDPGTGVHPGMRERFIQRLVGIGMIDVLTDEAYRDLVFRIFHRLDNPVPV